MHIFYTNKKRGESLLLSLCRGLHREKMLKDRSKQKELSSATASYLVSANQTKRLGETRKSG